MRIDGQRIGQSAAEEPGPKPRPSAVAIRREGRLSGRDTPVRRRQVDRRLGYELLHPKEFSLSAAGALRLVAGTFLTWIYRTGREFETNLTETQQQVRWRQKRVRNVSGCRELESSCRTRFPVVASQFPHRRSDLFGDCRCFSSFIQRTDLLIAVAMKLILFSKLMTDVLAEVNFSVNGELIRKREFDYTRGEKKTLLFLKPAFCWLIFF